ncbi:hypothetical protein [Lactococcus lactis]|uniref:hypothetical protein n=1 Tax=Lactococcus lactis TaxID=1358 RepID=UPI0024A9FFA8|nr:hypothetical protein [Lactococcus lactis]
MLTKKDYEGLYELAHAFEEETKNKSSLRYPENKKVTYTVLYQSKNLVIYVEDKKRKPVIDVTAILVVIAFLLIITDIMCLLVMITV